MTLEEIKKQIDTLYKELHPIAVYSISKHLDNLSLAELLEAINDYKKGIDKQEELLTCMRSLHAKKLIKEK